MFSDMPRPNGGGSGELQETVLWTNPNPSAQQGYGPITLNQDINNFKYIKFTIKGYSGWTDENLNVNTLISVDDFKKLKGDSNGGCLCLTAVNSGAGVFTRRLYYQNDTSIYVYMGLRLNADGTNNAFSILVQVTGLK